MVFRMIHVKDSLLPMGKVWCLDLQGIGKHTVCPMDPMNQWTQPRKKPSACLKRPGRQLGAWCATSSLGSKTLMSLTTPWIWAPKRNDALDKSGQMEWYFHQPRFPWSKRDIPSKKLPFGVTESGAGRYLELKWPLFWLEFKGLVLQGLTFKNRGRFGVLRYRYRDITEKWCFGLYLSCFQTSGWIFRYEISLKTVDF